MHLSIKLLLTVSGIFMALTQLPGSCGRSLTQPLVSQDESENSILVSPFDANQLTKPGPVHLRRRVIRQDAPADGDAPAGGDAPAAPVQQENKLAPEVPYDFNTKHLPCDMDTPNLAKYVTALPNHCIFMFNNRYASEKYYYGYKLFQLEGFFFGQYYERLKRFEIDPHEFDYAS